MAAIRAIQSDDAGIAGEDGGGLAVERLQPPQPLVEREIREPGRAGREAGACVRQQVFHPAQHEAELVFLVG